ncbi:MAG: methylenetetrahydrofolate reductase [Atribacterota bacterium]|jgi:5,10-methylenetetrahydrofolate reductase|nr:methylenetetrahydrofolate reductase [Atribacterota bacterium]MDD3640722.1 methylenetetrahydrofolate reductase [Atribacterota bacterium]
MNLKEKLKNKKFVYTLELDPPLNMNIEKLLENIKQYLSKADAINITDCPLACLRMSPIALSHIIQEKLNLETIFHITCRDRNLLALKAELLGAHALGVKNILALTGDHPEMGDHKNASAVFDVGSTGLVKIIQELNEGNFLEKKKSDYKTDFSIGVAGNPGTENIEEEAARLEEKAEAGASFIQTQPIFNLDILEKFLDRTSHINIPKIIGIMPLRSKKMVDYIDKNLSHIFIPENVRNRMIDKDIEEGICIAQEIIYEIRTIKEAAGVHIYPMNRFSIIPQIIKSDCVDNRILPV